MFTRTCSRLFSGVFVLALCLSGLGIPRAAASGGISPGRGNANQGETRRPEALFITVDTTWNTNQTLNQDVVIQNGATLTIQNGVTVSIDCTDTAPYAGGLDATRIEIIIENGNLQAQGAAFVPSSVTPERACWYGLEFRAGTGGYVRHSTISGGIVGVTITASSPEISHNTIEQMAGPDGANGANPGDAGQPGSDGIGIAVSGSQAQPIISGNEMRNLSGGAGGDGAAGPDGVAPPGPINGLAGGAGGGGGAGIGIRVGSEAEPAVSGNLILDVTGGGGGRGGVGGNGYAYPLTTVGAGNIGGNGGAGGAGGRGGDAVGVQVSAADPAVSDNTIGRQAHGLAGGQGGNGGLAGNGGLGEAGAPGVPVVSPHGGPGGAGGQAGDSGNGGSGGDAYGVWLLGAAAPRVAHNDVAYLSGGLGGNGPQGGLGGAGGMGGDGATESTAPIALAGNGGMGGAAGNGGAGGAAGAGGNAFGIAIVEATPQELARNALHALSGNDGGMPGAGGMSAPGGMGGRGGPAITLAPGAGGAGGFGGNGGLGGNGGEGGLAAGIFITATVGTGIASFPVVNNVIWDCQGGDASAQTGSGGDGGMGGMGGMSGAGGMLPGSGGNGGDGGFGGNGGNGGDAGSSVGLSAGGGAAPTFTNNTVSYGAAGSSGPAGTGGAAGLGGPGGLGDPPGAQGNPGSPGNSGQAGLAGYVVGAFALGQAHTALLNNIFRGPLTPSVNTYGIRALPPATATHDYNDVFGYATAFSPGGPGVHDLQLDPAFVGPADFHLQLASACVDSGSDGATNRPDDDRDGNPRPLDGNHAGTIQTDRGAYERGYTNVSKASSRTTVATNDVFTYTLVVDGSLLPPNTPTAVSITDAAPAGTQYNDHLAYTAGSATQSATGFTWTGSITRTVPVTITFQVTVITSSGTITNTASFTDPDGSWQTNRVDVTVSNAPLYGVSLTPPTAQHSGEAGDETVYTFDVENTGNTSDSYTLALAEDDWPTALSTTSVGPLAPGDSQTFEITVTLPSGALAGEFDAAWVTAESVGNAAVTDASIFTTTVAAHYALSLTPESDGRIANPGQVVTYTLTVHNDGNITDTYSLSKSGAPWPTALSAHTLGPVAPGEAASFDVFVTIPNGASDGEQDGVTLTAVSQGAMISILDSSILTTTATTTPIVRSVEISPATAAAEGLPGEEVTYQLTVTNTGSVADSITIQIGLHTWETTAHPALVSLAAGESAVITVTVAIPAQTGGGLSDVVVITAQGTGASDTSTLTTHSLYKLCLPLSLKNYAHP